MKNTNFFKISHFLFRTSFRPLLIVFLSLIYGVIYPEVIVEPIQACINLPPDNLSYIERMHIAECLKWQQDAIAYPLCGGAYQPLIVPSVSEGAVDIQSDSFSAINEGAAVLKGHVIVNDNQRIVQANTAYLYRDKSKKQWQKLILNGNVRYEEPDKLMLAKRAVIYPSTHAGTILDVIYRLGNSSDVTRMPAWGRAQEITRSADNQLVLKNVTYTTCTPTDNSWQIDAQRLEIDQNTDTGVARNAVLRFRNHPVLYTPYITFPTSNKRKSGFLWPTMGYSDIGGVDLSLPYYWNIAPNYDATIYPHLYTRRGMMMGADFRYLTRHSTGNIAGNFLPDDRAYKQFLHDNEWLNPSFQNKSANRYSFSLNNTTELLPNLIFDANVESVSDDNYLQDFSTNFAVATERQLLRQASLTYTTAHWLWRNLFQSYQTLNPINLTPVEPVYQRLPELFGEGIYDNLPGDLSFDILTQYDNFRFPVNNASAPEGPRVYANPILSRTFANSFGYITPSVEALGSQHNVSSFGNIPRQSFSDAWYRAYVDAGLFADREVTLNGEPWTQTLEPRIFYLRVPFRDQTQIPVYDSAYMFFNTDQLFRTNRFSGLDRIGDTNQFSYALTSRFISEETGQEKLSFTIGQTRYFSRRLTPLCYAPDGNGCVDFPLTLNLLSPDETFSPIAMQGIYHVSRPLSLLGGLAWDVAADRTENGEIILRYSPEPQKSFSAGVTFLRNGDITSVANGGTQNDALFQAVTAFAWPLNEKWSLIGAFNYNLSKNYQMLSLMGIQYDSCCWAVRLLGERSFNQLDDVGRVGYNDNFFIQFLLKGIGSVGSSSPSGTIRTFLPDYQDPFRR